MHVRQKGCKFTLMTVDYVLAGKPNSKHDSADGTEDGKAPFLHISDY